MTVLKIAREGKIILETELSKVSEALSLGTILPTDYYWYSGMAGWELISSRQSWNTPIAATPIPLVQISPNSISEDVRTVIKGKVLDFNLVTSTGTISGDDAVRYNFSGIEWKSSASMPAAGTRVEFEVRNGSAVAVYAASQQSTQVNIPLAAPAQVQSGGYYRSSDDRFLAGICGGLAHKWGRPTFFVRLVFFLFFPFILWFVYIVLWLAWKERSTAVVLPNTVSGTNQVSVSYEPKKIGCFKMGLIILGALILLRVLLAFGEEKSYTINENDPSALFDRGMELAGLRGKSSKDFNEAYRMLQRSAQFGNPQAFQQLGFLATQSGWPGHDRVQAWKWLTLAEKYGDDRTRRFASDMKKTISDRDYWEIGPITSEHKTEAERQVAAFVVISQK